MEKKQRHRGRPTVPATPGTRSTVSIRLTADIKQRLDRAAKENDRPLSQEAELRLERSFDREDLLGDALSLRFGHEVAGVLMAVGRCMTFAGSLTSKQLFTSKGQVTWTSEPQAFALAMRAGALLIEAFASDAERLRELCPQNDASVQVVDWNEALFVRLALEQIAYPVLDAADPEHARIRSLLGPIATKIATAIAAPEPSSKKGRTKK